jgi:predicted KAP-like P-loop ATPase
VTPESAVTHIVTDRALRNHRQDLLGRWAFSSGVADVLGARTDSESLVVGISARGGEGKSTVLNFIEEHLREDHSHVVCVRFAPWPYGSAKKVTIALFEAISHAVSAELRTKAARRVNERLWQVGDALASSLGSGSGGLSKPARAMSRKGLVKDKREIRRLLAKEDARIVVLVDEIDQLDDREVAALFKVVAATVDIDFIDFVLAFDSDAVARALKKRRGGRLVDGRRFVEKVVQLPLSLPPPSTSILRRMLIRGVTSILNDLGARPTSDENARLAGYIDGQIMNMVSTPRQVKRLVSAYSVAWSSVHNDVSYADLLLVEALRLLRPTVYEFIRRRKAKLVGADPRWMASSSSPSEFHDMIHAEFESARPRIPGAELDEAVEAVGQLFPLVRAACLRLPYSLEESFHATEGRRIASPNHFDRYFALGVPDGDVTSNELGSFLSSVDDLDETVVRLQDYFRSDRNEAFIQHLLEERSRIPEESARILALGIAQASHDLPLVGTGFDSVGSPTLQAANVTKSLLRDLPPIRRLLALQEVVRKATSAAYVQLFLTLWTNGNGDSVLEANELDEVRRTFAERLLAEGHERALFVTYGRAAVSMYELVSDALGFDASNELVKAETPDVPTTIAFLRNFGFENYSGPFSAAHNDALMSGLVRVVDPEYVVEQLRAGETGTGGRREPSELRADRQFVITFIDLVERFRKFVEEPEPTFPHFPTDPEFD